MQTLAPIGDLERRKQVKIRLRRDLVYSVQKYEGRTYHVVKDPVSLRYYRFEEQERFLLDFMDGEHTLDEAQKAFEERFRPKRLTLEDLEAFGMELLTAGLVENESPQAGKLLYERGSKRRRKEFFSRWFNILYIRVPIIDPDRLLERMVKPLRFIFTLWFLALSIGVMLAALMLVLSHWNVFLTKLPTFEEFFTLQTVLHVWIALGLVKVIHEFGHGLSCKAFGGEVHEMGFLFLCFSPCLYCNVSDSWTVPSKWKRIIIGGAGIYVELIIASLATFLWWTSDEGTFIHSLSMGLMIVCSVSTVIFNANPLMRFDGYYMLADWLEIPNLRERSNRFLQKFTMEHCLGMEVQPEPYMTPSRQWLFILYAIASYIYRWVITFSIIFMIYNFLPPKLQILSMLLVVGSLASLFGFPIYRLYRGLERRGRLPDMKPVRVWSSIGVIVVILVVLLTIPFPMRIKGLALIQVEKDQIERVAVPETGGFLRELLVRDGQRVQAGDVLAVLENPMLEQELRLNAADLDLRKKQIDDLARQGSENGSGGEQAATNRLDAEAALQGLRIQSAQLHRQKAQLTLRAPRDGTVMGRVTPEDAGKWLPKGTELCRIGDERALRAVVLLEPSDYSLIKAGNKAWIRVHGLGYNEWDGVVSEIAEAEAKDIPPQLSSKAGGDVVTEEDPTSKTEKPKQQHYLVSVRFEQPNETIQPGAMGRVKIVAEPQTAGWRFWRYLAKTFNWAL